MKLAFLVNDVGTEKDEYSTTRLAFEATRLGHEVWYLGAGDFAVGDDALYARARTTSDQGFETPAAYLEAVRGEEGGRRRIDVGEMDVLFLRADPASETGSRSWAQSTGVLFGRLAMRRGVVVLNDPGGLAAAMNKTYLHEFPEEVRPRSLITRDAGEIKAFIDELDGSAVIKPLVGSGGHNVFLIRPDDSANLNQMIEAVMSEGYVIVQEYLEEIENGDTRLLLMNGEPLVLEGRYAALRRRREGGDLRSNLTAGGKLAPATIGETELALAEIVRPRLVKDGMFLVGLDIVGSKLMEINVFSPAGLGSAQSLEGVPFARAVIGAIERKVKYARTYGRRFENVEMATL